MTKRLAAWCLQARTTTWLEAQIPVGSHKTVTQKNFLVTSTCRYTLIKSMDLSCACTWKVVCGGVEVQQKLIVRTSTTTMLVQSPSGTVVVYICTGDTCSTWLYIVYLLVHYVKPCSTCTCTCNNSAWWWQDKQHDNDSSKTIVVVSSQKQQITTINHYHSVRLTFVHTVLCFGCKTSRNNNKKWV